MSIQTSSLVLDSFLVAGVAWVHLPFSLVIQVLRNQETCCHGVHLTPFLELDSPTDSKIRFRFCCLGPNVSRIILFKVTKTCKWGDELDTEANAGPEGISIILETWWSEADPCPLVGTSVGGPTTLNGLNGELLLTLPSELIPNPNKL